MLKSRYLFLAGILSLLISDIEIYGNHLGIALRFVQISFSIFTAGLVFYLWGLRNER